MADAESSTGDVFEASVDDDVTENMILAKLADPQTYKRRIVLLITAQVDNVRNQLCASSCMMRTTCRSSYERPSTCTVLGG